MKIYKIVATFGMEHELDSRIYFDLHEAFKGSIDWYKEDADNVTIYEEEPDIQAGYFRTTKAHQVKKPF